MWKKERGKVGFVQFGLEKLSNLFNVLFSDNIIPDFHNVLGYIITAVIGTKCT